MRIERRPLPGSGRKGIQLFVNLASLHKIQSLLSQFQSGDKAAGAALADLLRPGVAFLLSHSVAEYNVAALTEDALRHVIDLAHFGSAQEMIRTTSVTVYAICGDKADKSIRDFAGSQEVLLEMASLPDRTREFLYRSYGSRESPDEISRNMALSDEDFRKLKAEGKAAIYRCRLGRG